MNHNQSVVKKSTTGLDFLAFISRNIDKSNDKIGKVVSWLLLFMLVTQMSVVILRYVFGVGSIKAQESITYAYGTLFMLASSYALLHDSHVRVDILYREMSKKKAAFVDVFCTFIFLFPVCALIFYTALPIVITSWHIREGSTETSGLQGIYLFKTIMVIFPVLMGLQGLSKVICGMFVIFDYDQKIYKHDSLK